jgi:hypothetical protein
LANVNAYLAGAAGYARRGYLHCTKAINPQPISRQKCDSAFPQFLQLRNECGRTVGKVPVVPPKFLSVGAKNNYSGKPYNLVLRRKFAVLSFKFGRLLFATREIEFYDDQVVPREVLKFRL